MAVWRVPLPTDEISVFCRCLLSVAQARQCVAFISDADIFSHLFLVLLPMIPAELHCGLLDISGLRTSLPTRNSARAVFTVRERSVEHFGMGVLVTCVPWTCQHRCAL